MNGTHSAKAVGLRGDVDLAITAALTAVDEPDWTAPPELARTALNLGVKSATTRWAIGLPRPVPTSWKSLAGSWESAGNVSVGPSRESSPLRARPWLTMAIRPAQAGAPTLVPPTWIQGADGWLYE